MKRRIPFYHMIYEDENVLVVYKERDLLTIRTNDPKTNRLNLYHFLYEEQTKKGRPSGRPLAPSPLVLQFGRVVFGPSPFIPIKSYRARKLLPFYLVFLGIIARESPLLRKLGIVLLLLPILSLHPRLDGLVASNRYWDHRCLTHGRHVGINGIGMALFSVLRHSQMLRHWFSEERRYPLP